MAKSASILSLPLLLSVTLTTSACSKDTNHGPEAQLESIDLQKPSTETSVLVWIEGTTVFAHTCMEFAPDTAEGVANCKSSGTPAFPPQALEDYRTALLRVLPLDPELNKRIHHLQGALAELKKITDPVSREEWKREISATESLIANLQNQGSQEADQLIAKLGSRNTFVVYFTEAEYNSILDPFVNSAAAGISQNVAEASLAPLWKQCFRKSYGDSSADPIAAIRNDCAGERIMLACGRTGSGVLTLAATVNRQAFLEIETPHPFNGVPSVLNGTGFYHSFNSALGFAPAGSSVQLNSCDTITNTGNNLRMCWHLNSSGWRCGEESNLNSSSNWEKVIYSHD